MTKRKYDYLHHLILTAKKNEIEEYLYYEQKGRKLTAKQIELILLRNGVKIPKDETPKISKEQIKKDFNKGFYGHGDIATNAIQLRMKNNMLLDDVIEQVLWCQDNCADKWLLGIGYRIAAFENHDDATLYKLTWS